MNARPRVRERERERARARKGEGGGAARKVDEEMDKLRAEERVIGGRERGEGALAGHADVRKYETGRVIGLSRGLCDRAATLLFIELSLMIENHYTLIVRVIRFTRPSAPTVLRNDLSAPRHFV